MECNSESHSDNEKSLIRRKFNKDKCHLVRHGKEEVEKWAKRENKETNAGKEIRLHNEE